MAFKKLQLIIYFTKFLLLTPFHHLLRITPSWVMRLYSRVQLKKKAEVFSIKGLVKKTDMPLNCVFVGRKESAYQLAHLMYSSIERIIPLDNRSSGTMNSTLLPKAEITAIHIERRQMGRFAAQGYLLLPYLRFFLDLKPSVDTLIQKSSRRRRRNIKRLSNFNYEYGVSAYSEEDFDFFYYKMYLPYTKNHFRKAAKMSAYLELKNYYMKNGGIIFVTREKKIIAGILFQIRGDTLCAIRSGVYNGDYKFIANLAGQAALFFLIKWAKQRRLKTLNYGCTMPFFRDGIFTYKREWGMFVEEEDDQPVCALRLGEPNERILSFLEQQPFIFLQNGVIKGAVFIDHKPSKTELQRIQSKLLIPKIDSLVVISYYNLDSDCENKLLYSKSIPEELIRPLSVFCKALQGLNFKTEIYILPSQHVDYSTY